MPQRFPALLLLEPGRMGTQRDVTTAGHIIPQLHTPSTGATPGTGVFESPTAHLSGQVSSLEVSSTVCCPPVSSQAIIWERVRLGAAVACRELGPAGCPPTTWVRQRKAVTIGDFPTSFFPFKELWRGCFLVAFCKLA